MQARSRSSENQNLRGLPSFWYHITIQAASLRFSWQTHFVTFQVHVLTISWAPPSPPQSTIFLPLISWSTYYNQTKQHLLNIGLSVYLALSILTISCPDSLYSHPKIMFTTTMKSQLSSIFTCTVKFTQKTNDKTGKSDLYKQSAFIQRPHLA